MSRTLVFSLIFFAVTTLGLGPGGGFPVLGARALEVLAWNVQNLSDALWQGHEYPEYDPRQGRWNQRLYQGRLGRVAQGLEARTPGGPDLVFLAEVEHVGVLRDLARSRFPRGGYRWFAWTGRPGGGMGLGFMSRRPLREARIQGLYTGRGFGGAVGGVNHRGLLVVVLEDRDGKGTLVVGNHWKSLREGEEATAPARDLAAAELARLVASAPRGLALGDFNQADPGALVRRRLGEAVPSFRGVLPPGPGTYRFRGHWETLDHVLVWGADIAWEEGPAMPWPGADLAGLPLPWDPRSGQGFSDHLPRTGTLRLP